MSFSRNVKLEILKQNLDSDCCPFAFFNALIHATGEISIKDKKFALELITDMQELYGYCNNILKTLYDDYCELEIEDDYSINKRTYYRITFPDSVSQTLLIDCGILGRDEDGNLNINKDTPNHIIISECCKKAFIKGAYLGSATSNIKISEKAYQKTSSGYHLEFTAHNYDFLVTLSNILSEFNLMPKIAPRKNVFVLYLKEANQISDVLALVGANESVLALQNEIIAREMRNKINRETNCYSANISKTVDASMKQLDAIQTIIDIIGIDKLPYELEEVALLRLANQEESLEELINLSSLKLTRSGLNYRFKKLIKLAEELKK